MGSTTITSGSRCFPKRRSRFHGGFSRPISCTATTGRRRLCPCYLQECWWIRTSSGPVPLLTIHNLGYQGVFEPAAMREIGLPQNLFHPGRYRILGQDQLSQSRDRFRRRADHGEPASMPRRFRRPSIGFGLDGLLARRRGVAERHSERRRLCALESGDRSGHPGAIFRGGSRRQADLQAGTAARTGPARGSHRPAAAGHRLALCRPEGFRSDRRDRPTRLFEP